VTQIPLHKSHLYGACSPRSLTFLCEILSESSCRSLNIAVIPKNLVFSNFGNDHCNAADALRSFEYVRNVETAIVRDADVFEVPDFVTRDEDALRYESHFENLPELQVELTFGLQESGPVEILSRIYGQLLTYAQAFERHPYFKSEMALPLTQSPWGLLDVVGQADEATGILLSDYNNTPNRNPFRGESVHPVDESLTQAYTVHRDIDGPLFKVCRARVISELERPYQRISIAAGKIAEFVKSQKKSGGFLEYYFQARDEGNDFSPVVCAIDLLKEYRASFERDIPDKIPQFKR
jgi:hypothetical protein